MKSALQRNALVVFLGLVLSFQAFSQTADQDFLSHLESLQSPQYISTPENTHQALYDAFDAAKSTIRVGIFGISDRQIIDHLVAAEQRGVDVTVICDSYCTKSPTKKQLIDRLSASGVKVYTASSGFSISHWKMFVVDENLAFISTMNFISMSDEMRDMGVFIRNPSVIKEILSVFNQDIENSKNQTALTPELSQPNLVWSPVNSEAKITALIQSAQSSIDIWIENMGEHTVQQALKDALTRGVKVRVLTSLCGLGMPPKVHYPILHDLMSSGASVKGEPYPASHDVPYIHAKSINVDQRTVYLGSENFSYNSLMKSRELGIIFSDSEIINKMHSLYEKDWSHAQDIPDQAPPKCSAFILDNPTDPTTPVPLF